MRLPSSIKKYFWDADFNTLDIQKHSSYLITRLLEYGDEKAILWMLNHISRKKIKTTVMESRELSPKSANFWGLLLNINKIKIRCLKKSYQKMQGSHWRR
jgi:hypothetical protein